MIDVDKVCAAYDELGVDKGQTVAIAVSGGADSLALLLLSHAKYRVTAITVDHGLRKEARDEAKYVASVCEKIGVPHVTLTWDGEKPEGNIQAAARDARYELMRDWCSKNQAAYLAVAHHMDDQAETLLLRLARGSGVYGLSGMDKKRALSDDVTLIRPLLGFSKVELENYLSGQSIEWMEDPSNASTKYERVKARNMLMSPPLDGLTAERLSATADRLRRTSDALNYYEAKWLRSSVCEYDSHATIRVSSFQEAPEETVLRGLSTICRVIGGQRYVPRMEKLERLKHALTDESFKGQTLFGVQFDRLSNGHVLVSRELNNIEADIALTASGLWDSRFSYIADGDVANLTISPVGKKGLLFLKKFWLEFKNIDIPKQVICGLPAVYEKDELQAVPSLGYSVLQNTVVSFSSTQFILTKK